MAHVIDAVLQLKDNFSQQLQYVSKNLSHFQKQTKYVASDMKRVAKNSEKIGYSLTKGITIPIVGVGGAAIKSAIQCEDSFAGIRKTVDATKQQYVELEKQFDNMSLDIPVNLTELNHYGEVAGQLGVKRKDIAKFSKIIAELGFTTNLTGEEGASSLAKFSNIVGMDLKNIDRLGSSIVDLGNNFATTEADIVAMGLRLAGAGKQINLVPAQIMGISTTLSSLGIEAEAGGTAFSKVMLNINNQVYNNSGILGDYAKICGTTKEEFRKIWKKDSIKGLEMFADGLGKLKGKGANLSSILDELGYKEVRTKDTLLRLSTSNGMLTKSVKLASEAWQKNSALQNETEQKFNTTASQLKLLKNHIIVLGKTFRNMFLPNIKKGVNYTKNLINKLRKLTPEQQKNIVNFAKWAVIMGPTILGISKIAKTTSNTIIGINKLSRSINKAGGMMKFLSSPGHKFVMIMYALALVAILVITHWDKVKACFNSVSKSISKATGISQNSVNKFLIGAITGLTTLFSFGTIFTKGFGGGFKILNKIIKGSGKGIFGTFKLLGKGLLKSLKGTVSIIKVVGKGVGIALKGIGTGAATAFKLTLKIITIAGKGIGKGLMGMLKIFRIIGSGIIKIAGRVFVFLAANPIVAIIMVIIGIVILLHQAWKHNWGGIREKTKVAIDFCKQKINSIKETFNTVKEKCIEFKEKIIEIWNNIKEFVKHPIKGTVNLIQKGVDKAKGKKPGENALGTPFWQGGLTWVGEHGPELMELPSGSKIHDARNSLKMATPQIKKLNANSWGKDIPKTLASGITNSTHLATKATKNLAQNIRELIHFSVPDKGPLSDADKYGGDMVTLLANGVKNNTKIATNATTRMAKRSKNVITNFKRQCLPIGKGISTTLAQGINSSSNSVISATKKLTNKVINQFKEGFGIHSPSRVLFQIGKFLLEGFINGMSSMDVKGFIKSQIGDITTFFTNSSKQINGNVTKWLTAALMATSTPLNWLPGLQKLVMAESGGNPLSWNPVSVGGEHATGLLQTLPSTFKEFMQDKMSNILDPIHNTAAAINYIKSRYGSVYNTPLFRGGSYFGYAKGTSYAAPGLHWVGEEGPELMELRGGEKVVDHNSSMKLGNGDININFTGDIHVREEADIDKIATKLAYKLKTTKYNMA